MRRVFSPWPIPTMCRQAVLHTLPQARNLQNADMSRIQASHCRLIGDGSTSLHTFGSHEGLITATSGRLKTLCGGPFWPSIQRIAACYDSSWSRQRLRVLALWRMQAAKKLPYA